MDLSLKTLFLVLLITAKGFFSMEIIDRIVAVVGDDIILKSEVDQFVEQKKIFGITGDEESLRAAALEELISVRILYDIAKRDTTIAVSDEEVQTVLDSRINPIIQQVGGERRFEEIYNTTVSDLRRHYRTEIRKGLLVDRLKNRHLSGITATRREVEAFYRDYKDSIPPAKPSVTVSQLFISISGDAAADAAALRKITAVRADIVSGDMSFEEAAEKHSHDVSSASKGGNIGFTSRGDLVPEYERVAYNLEKGEISYPVRTSFGYHLIKVNEKIGERIDTSHILLRPMASDEEDSEAYIFAQSVRDSIMNKQMTFEEAVRKHSTDERTRYNDGYVGVLNFEDMDARYYEIFKDIDPGSITEPVKDKDGYYIFRVLDKRSDRRISIETDYNILRNMASEHKRDAEMNKWIDELRKKVYIDVK